MKNLIAIPLALTCLCVSLQVACSPITDEEKKNEMCPDLCAKLELCDSSTDESDCVEYCQADRSLSIAYWTSYSTCVEDSSCNQLYEDNLVDCIGDEISQYYYSTDIGKAACQQFATTLENCDQAFDETSVYNSCIEINAAYFSDHLLLDLKNCFSGNSCDEIDWCVTRVFDDYDMNGLEDFFFTGLGVQVNTVGCQSDLDCPYGEYCSSGTNTCIPAGNQENECIRAIDVRNDGIDDYCRGENCAFCVCWNQGQKLYDIEEYANSGNIVCLDEPFWDWDAIRTCSGDVRNFSRECMDDIHRCRSEAYDLAEFICN